MRDVRFAGIWFALWLVLLLGLAACGGSPRASPTISPAPLAVLNKILNDCWGVSQIQDLDGTRSDQTGAFECARGRLLQMAQAYPDLAESHRVLAWGYLYSLKDEAAAQAELERAAQIYAEQGNRADQADMVVRIAVQLTMPHDQPGGCLLLTRAAGIDPDDARIPVLLQNFNCVPRTNPPPLPSATQASAAGTSQPSSPNP